MIELRALRTPHLEKTAEGHHLPLSVSRVKVPDVLGLQAVTIVRLDIDLVDLVELVEEVDEGGSQIAPERLKYVVERNLKGLGLCPVDVQV